MTRPAFRVLFSLAALLFAPTWGHAETARDLSRTIQIDGYTDDFAPDESIFGIDSVRNVPQESSSDSKWGVNNDIRQIRITWDAQNLYLAGEGKTWDNNMILLLDTVPGRGMTDMKNLNSWKRNFTFPDTARFQPDVFGATWDGNTSPRFITQLSGNQVDDQQVGPVFRAAATFLRDNDNRAMEFAIPWRAVFAGLAGVGTRDTLMTVGGITDTIRRMPRGVTSIKIVGVITAGGDGTGGPDSAPDNLRGHTDNSGDQVDIDNFAIIELDRNDDTGTGGGGPDGVPDWGVSPRSRVRFQYPPPIDPLRFSIKNLAVDRPAFAPDRGERARFEFTLDPPLDSSKPTDRARQVTLSADIYDAGGRWVRSLFRNFIQEAILGNAPLRTPKPGAPDGLEFWDGRDQTGRIVKPGIYILRFVIESNIDRATRAVVVVR